MPQTNIENIEVNIKDWEITPQRAERMIEHRRSDTRNQRHNMSNIIDYNDTVREAVMKAHPQGKGTWEDARYLDEEDEIRYCKNWKIPDESNNQRGKKGKVKDYKTKIFKVTETRDGLREGVFYYDLGMIKPPPDED